MSFISSLKKFGTEALKIGGYVILGLEGVQTVSSEVVPGATATQDFLSKGISIVTDIETAGAALGTTLGTNGLTGPQKLQAATTLISQELVKYAGANASKKLADAASLTSSAQNIAQGIVDYLNAFDQGIVTTVGTPTTPQSAVAAKS